MTRHRFTPPTCTLEINGQKSPLSRWTKQDIVQKIKFKLKFDDPRQPTSKQITIQGNQQDLSQLYSAVNHYAQEQLHTSFKVKNTREKSQQETKIQTDDPYLKSQGLVHHQLFFGSLNHNSNSHNMRLSTVQLFDLVTALEACQTKIATLPETKSSVSHHQKILPLWGGIAAVAIATIGITTMIFKAPWQQNIASSPESQTLPQAEIPELDEIIPPQSPATVQQPIAKPKLTKPLTSANRLPPPPAVDTPKPKPDIPDPADYPIADVARQSDLNNSQKQTNTPKQPAESIIVFPETNPTKESTIAPEKKIETESTFLAKEQKDQIDTTINSELDSELDIINNPPVNSVKDQATSQNSELAIRDSSESTVPRGQIQEVEAYFKNQWQPPADLKQSLEYRLLLNQDGSIKKVIPLGKASRLYLSQTNIPVNGESFMSPPSPTQSSTIRLLLNPDGNVQAFIE